MAKPLFTFKEMNQTSGQLIAFSKSRPDVMNELTLRGVELCNVNNPTSMKDKKRLWALYPTQCTTYHTLTTMEKGMVENLFEAVLRHWLSLPEVPSNERSFDS